MFEESIRRQETLSHLDEAAAKRFAAQGHFGEGEGAGQLTEYQQTLLNEGRGASLILGPYVLEEKIREGGMGQVYRAVHVRLQQRVAIKMLSPHLLRDPHAVIRFLREIEIISSLHHPGITAAFDAQVHSDERYLVMEYVNGLDVDQVVRQQGPLSVPDAIEIIRQAALALQCVHARGIVHRDVKPSNLMLDKQGRIKVTDFGLAKLLSPTIADQCETARPSLFGGTVGFLAPEQASGLASAGPAADLYSLGCTLNFLLMGEAPCEGQAVLPTFHFHRSRRVYSLRRLRPDVPRTLDALLQKMIAPTSSQRPGSMAELEQKLRRIASELPPPNLSALSQLGRATVRSCAAAETKETVVARTEGQRPGRREAFPWLQTLCFHKWLMLACVAAAGLAACLRKGSVLWSITSQKRFAFSPVTRASVDGSPRRKSILGDLVDFPTFLQ